MLPRTALPCLILAVFCSAPVLGQQRPAAAATTPTPAGVAEFPVVLREKVAAGKTPAGTKIEAKLSIATFVNGTVIPKNATFSGEVIESVAKTAAVPSRLAIRMDSAQWKDGSASVKIYLTPWYYPTTDEAGQNLQYGPPQSPKKTWNGMGQYPDPNSPAYRPFPSATDSDKGPSVPDTPASVTSNHRVPMKDVESEHGTDGAITLVSKNANIKLDRYTTYVLAATDLTAAKKQ